MLETEQASSTFKHLPVLQTTKGGKPAECMVRAVLGRPQRCFINPIKQVDGEGLTDNLHLANEACDSFNLQTRYTHENSGARERGN